MRRTALDVYSYAQGGDDRARRLTVALKGAQGKRVREDGDGCSPLVLTAR